jgi:hypothetical protein
MDIGDEGASRQPRAHPPKDESGANAGHHQITDDEGQVRVAAGLKMMGGEDEPAQDDALGGPPHRGAKR